ncbi:tRNA (adenosine(37)-N6)-threonylcarbamoyltransferase complex ATPase subunit type 1 TsaE [Lutimaribacter marinistellae]|uniref:tRNA threonylcarbamoyladenosine biosynthesis protein TsaE n=1 Tax=Lutimaribacter marinistellae TaxID=1820329 RepID=A0ABV7TF96_9RHOB
MSLTFETPEETAAFARRLGALLHAGHVLLLEGEIGAGKTHFARALIQSRLDTPEDVPSPTFTLVQTYETSEGEIWHCDLYRLTAPEEIEELGLIDAFESAICVIEWPDRLGPLAPASALTMRFRTDESDVATRHVDFHWSTPGWTGLLEDAA